jgi:molybdopterin synthase sulfur carrier subunit
MIRISLPYHLQTLARVGREVEIESTAPVTIGAALDALETKYPVLRGTIRDYATGQRRAFIRFFACGQDHSLAPLDSLLPEDVLKGAEPFRVVGAMAGG